VASRLSGVGGSGIWRRDSAPFESEEVLPLLDEGGGEE